MPTPEPGPSKKGKLKLWQFSLRSLMILMGGVALFLGISGLRLWNPVLALLTLCVFMAQNWLLLLLALRIPLPGQGGIARALAVCFTLAFVVGIYGSATYPSRYYVAYLLLIPASLASWPILALLVWLFRRPNVLPDRRGVRRASAIHLLIETTCLVVAVVSLYAHAAKENHSLFQGYFDSGAALLAVLANAIPVVLWLSLFSPWRNIPQRAWPDSLFRWTVIVAFGIAVVSFLYGFYLATNRERLDEYYSSRGEYEFLWYPISLGLFFWLPQTVCAGMFIVGVVCQLFRAHQDRWLIALGCLYFIPFWLVLLVAPRLLH
ncbi:MAG: hypothetical protein ACR2FY_16435 [Pirellulaceae bacterium]